MNTRGSNSAASKTSKKAVDHEQDRIQVTAAKVPDLAGQPLKPMQSKEIKSIGGEIKNASKIDPVVVKHTGSSPDESPKRSIFKSTFNTSDIMHAPVEKTIQMLDKILAGERLFTM